MLIYILILLVDHSKTRNGQISPNQIREEEEEEEEESNG